MKLPHKIKDWLKQVFIGSEWQQYNCLAAEFSDPMKVHRLTDTGQEPGDDHLFLGYQPLIIGIPNLDYEQKKLRLEFRQGEIQAAQLDLGFEAVFKSQSRLWIGTGQHGRHRFIPLHQQWFRRLRHTLTASRRHNIYLGGNLHEQVRIAYAIPREISLISLGDGVGSNLFPTDLHGPYGNKHYVISLRIGGKAADQVARLGRLALSRIPANLAALAYEMGKNHMQELKASDAFPFEAVSVNFNLPLPKGLLSYRELELIETLDIGIHRLHLFEVAGLQECQAGDRLTHIHGFYVGWRKKLGLPTLVRHS